jgi:hypothetical protein
MQQWSVSFGGLVMKSDAKENSNQESFRFVYKAPSLKEERVSFKNFESLPGCVASYLRSVLQEGQPILRDARIHQLGEFRIKEKGGWYPFDANQSVTTEPISFAWDANIRMSRIAHIKVHDEYSDGHGSMQAKLFGFVPFVNQRGAAELDTAALQRYLAEAAWFPTALLPGDRLVWQELDGRRALATLRNSGIEVSLEFDFNRNNEIDGVFTPGRYSFSHGKYELVPWGGYFRNYQEINHVRIPTEAEVQWIYRERSFSYFRGRIARIDFNHNLPDCESCCL